MFDQAPGWRSFSGDNLLRLTLLQWTWSGLSSEIRQHVGRIMPWLHLSRVPIAYIITWGLNLRTYLFPSESNIRYEVHVRLQFWREVHSAINGENFVHVMLVSCLVCNLQQVYSSAFHGSTLLNKFVIIITSIRRSYILVWWISSDGDLPKIWIF